MSHPRAVSPIVGRFGAHAARGLLVVGVLAAVACRIPVAADGGADPRACQQTYEFGNTGCLEVQGQVVSASGLPLAGMSVGPRPLPGPAVFNSDYATTDAAGQFRIRLSRISGAPPPKGTPDTLSVYVVAADPRSADVGIPARVRDSVLTVVTIAPVGTIPTPAVVRVPLPVP